MGRSFKAVALCALLCLSASAVRDVHGPSDVRAASRVYSVKECFATISWGRIPLRHGNRDFGYRHIEQRRGYTPAIRQLIRRTLLMRRRGFPPPNVGVDATDVSICPG